MSPGAPGPQRQQSPGCLWPLPESHTNALSHTTSCTMQGTTTPRPDLPRETWFPPGSEPSARKSVRLQKGPKNLSCAPPGVPHTPSSRCTGKPERGTADASVCPTTQGELSGGPKCRRGTRVSCRFWPSVLGGKCSATAGRLPATLAQASQGGGDSYLPVWGAQLQDTGNSIRRQLLGVSGSGPPSEHLTPRRPGFSPAQQGHIWL